MKPATQPTSRQAPERPAIPAPKAPPTLGSVVRNLRQRNDWTLKEMSQHTGIPLSTLAKVEHDRLTLTYDKLQQLSQRLQIPLSSLFADPSDPVEPRVSGRRSIGRRDQFVKVDTEHYEYRYLCTELRSKRMIPVLGSAHARTIEEFGPLVKHAGEEFIYVLKGSLEVHTEYYDPVVLEVGECIYIDSDMGHAYLAGPGGGEAFFMAVCSSAEEGLMETLLGVHKNGAGRLPEAPWPPSPTPTAGNSSPKARRRKKRA
jgi:transcriptional regulator with XRE-family HTH domain